MELFYLIVLSVYGVAAASEWSYSGSHGPAHWKEYYPTCGGNSQSPINIISADAVLSEDLGAFTFVGYDTPLASGQMSNNGHSIKVVAQASEGQFKLSGGNLSEVYILAQFHFHFGSKSSQGSEHQIDGKSVPLEAHFVHYRSDLGSVGNALSDPAGLAVLAVNFEEKSSDNANLDPIIDMLRKIAYKDDSIELDTSSLSLKSLMSSDQDSYFRYQGSLTTPSCSEAVVWSVFSTPSFISQAQLEKFRSVQLSTVNASQTPENSMQDNFRPVQPLNGRRVYTSTPGGAATLSSFFSVLVCCILAQLLEWLPWGECQQSCLVSLETRLIVIVLDCKQVVYVN